MRSPHHVLLRPRLTEKSAELGGEDQSTVVFEVPVDASKAEIRSAVESAFNVEVDGVRTMIVRGKIKRRGRHIGKQPNFKKAIVTLAEGEDIDLYGNAV